MIKVQKQVSLVAAFCCAFPSFFSSLSAVESLSVITLPMKRVLSSASDNLDASAVGGTPTAPPNFLFILSDDHGWAQMSVAMDPDNVPQAASSYLETPSLAALAASGMRFSDGYSPSPNCTPTRRAILGGISAARSGTEFPSPNWVPAAEGRATIPRVLKQVDPDYMCAHFGKWGEDINSTPAECGYDVSDGETSNSTGFLGNRSHQYTIDDVDAKLTIPVTNRTKAFITEQVNAGAPFYAQVSYYAVHQSIQARRETLEKYYTAPVPTNSASNQPRPAINPAKGNPDRNYGPGWAAMLEEMDEGVGELLDHLDDLGIADNTYVVFMGDNGGRNRIPGAPGDNNTSVPTSTGRSSNWPLSGAKNTLDEGGVRVPFMVRGPGITANSICRVPVNGYDLLPTFYDLAGGTGPLTNEIDGGSLTSLFADPVGGSVNRPSSGPGGLVFHRPNRSESAYRQGQYKLYIQWTNSNATTVRRTRLYDMNVDPFEATNIASANPEIVNNLQSAVVAYLNTTAIDAPNGPNPPPPN